MLKNTFVTPHMGKKIIIKNNEQIKGIKRSCQLSAKTLQHLKQFIHEGTTTEILNQEAEKFIRDHGGLPAPLNYGGFPKSICTSINDVVCHGIPGEQFLTNGDIISIDVSTILDGYYGDNCATFPVGEISKEARELIKVTKKALQVGIDEVKPDNRFGNIGYKIQKLCSKHNYGVVYQFSGHGVGLDLHEEPEVNHSAQKNSGQLMKPGMIFTIEPMVNIGTARVKVDKHDKWTARTADGKLSAQFEHTVLVTKSGYEILTFSPGQTDF